MADVTIYGMPQSTFARTCRMVCEEKGIRYDNEYPGPHSPEILALSPTGKVPAFRHGDLVLWESGAICRYLDEAFGGPKLQPADAVSRARMNLWLGMIQDWIYQTMIRDIVLPRFGLIEADDAKLEQAAGNLAKQLACADQTLQQSAWLAGEQLTLADLYLAPILFWLEKTPEGQAALPRHAAIGRWYQAIGERPSFQRTMPPMPGQEAA